MKGHIRKRGKKWSIIIDLERGPDGKRKQKWFSGFDRKKDAEREMVRLLNEVNTHTYVEPAKDTVGEHLTRWLGSIATDVGSLKTLERYKEIVTVHLIPYFGAIRLDHLTEVQILEYKTWALANGRKGGGPLARQTVHHHMRIFRQALEMAVDLGLRRDNPARKVKLPSPSNKVPVVLNAEQVRHLLEQTRGTEDHIRVALAVGTGARRGELLALRWQDVDLNTGRLTICRSLEETTAGGFRFKEPKTRAGRRTLTLPPFVLEALKEHRRQQFEQRQLLEEAYHDDGLILCRADGHPVRPDTLSQQMTRILARAGFPGATLHGLRHTCGSLVLQQKPNVKMAQALLGHASVQILLNRYAHLLGGEMEEAASLLENALAGEVEGPAVDSKAVIGG